MTQYTQEQSEWRSSAYVSLESVEDEDKIFYVNSSKLDVSTLYLECLCSIPALLERGVLVISCHKL